MSAANLTDCRTLGQLDSNLAALGVALTADQMSRLNAASGSTPVLSSASLKALWALASAQNHRRVPGAGANQHHSVRSAFR